MQILNLPDYEKKMYATQDHLHENGLNGKVSSNEEPIKLPWHIVELQYMYQYTWDQKIERKRKSCKLQNSPYFKVTQSLALITNWNVLDLKILLNDTNWLLITAI